MSEINGVIRALEQETRTLRQYQDAFDNGRFTRRVTILVARRIITRAGLVYPLMDPDGRAYRILSHITGLEVYEVRDVARITRDYPLSDYLLRYDFQLGDVWGVFLDLPADAVQTEVSQ